MLRFLPSRLGFWLEARCCSASVFPPRWLPGFARGWWSDAGLSLQARLHRVGFDPSPPPPPPMTDAEIAAWFGETD